MSWVPGLSFPKKGFDGAVDGGSSAAKVFADRGKSVVSVKPLICHGLLIIVVRFLIMIEWLRRSKREMGGLTPSVFGDVMFFIILLLSFSFRQVIIYCPLHGVGYSIGIHNNQSV